MEQNTDTTLKWSDEQNRWNKPKQSKAYQIAIVQIVLSMIKIEMKGSTTFTRNSTYISRACMVYNWV